MMSQITIAVPVYGVEKYIERCARSLFGQTYPEIEYLFVDDCTPDNSIIILKKVLEDYPDRKGHVRIIRHERNRGLGAARNTAVDNCQTEFIMHVDSDDSIERNALALLMQKMLEENLDILRFGFKKIYDNRLGKNEVWPTVASAENLTLLTLSRNVPVCVCGGVYRISLYRNNNIRVPEGVNNSEDYSVTPRLAFFAHRVDSVTDCLYNYYIGNEGAYTQFFSEAKAHQTLHALMENELFFKDKGEKYIDAFKEGESKVLTALLLGTLRNGNNYISFKEFRERLNNIENRNFYETNIYYKLLLKISNYRIACFLYRIPRFFYRMLYKFC